MLVERLDWIMYFEHCFCGFFLELLTLGRDYDRNLVCMSRLQRDYVYKRVIFKQYQKRTCCVVQELDRNNTISKNLM